MTDKKITALDALTVPGASDPLPIVDLAGGTVTKKITAENLLSYIAIGGTVYPIGSVTDAQYLQFSGGTIIGAAGGGGGNVVNSVINGGCVVAQAQAQSLGTAPTFGAVDRFACYATGTAVSAGTITQDVASTLGSGYALKISGATITGSGIVYVRHRIASKDAAYLKNLDCSFSASVLQDTGGAINYLITVRKANALDNFSAVTDIGNSGNLSVANNTATTIKLENLSMGDCSNGVEIEIKATCGAVTTKNFSYTNIVAAPGATAPTSFPYETYADTLAKCQQFYLQLLDAAAAFSAVGIYGQKYATKYIDTPIVFRLPMHKNPVLEQAGSTAWATSTPSGNKIGFYSGGYLTISGALTISIDNVTTLSCTIRCTADTSFSGTDGIFGFLYAGTGSKLGLRAEP